MSISNLVANRYRVSKEIGRGSFGIVHSAFDKKKKIKVAIKFSHFDSEFLKKEHEMYKILYRGPGIPKCFWYGKHEGYYSVLVMELMGKSLEEHFFSCNYVFSLKTILMLADQIIGIIEFLHKRCLLHRDIKPENFLTGLADKKHQVFLIDLGLSKFYCNRSTKDEHIDDRNDRKEITGTLRYLSLNGTKGHEPTRRDDLESLAYMLIYFLRGNLPWQGSLSTNVNKVSKREQVLMKKEKISLEDLCGMFPEEFSIFLLYTRNLGFKETPNYGYIKLLFKNLFHSCNYKKDMEFDWLSNTGSNERSSSSLNISGKTNSTSLVV